MEKVVSVLWQQTDTDETDEMGRGRKGRCTKSREVRPDQRGKRGKSRRRATFRFDGPFGLTWDWDLRVGGTWAGGSLGPRVESH